jgi:hypothetical protein
MRLSTRALVVGSFFVALAVVGVFALPAFAQDGGIDFWNVGKYQAKQKSEEEFRLELERRDDDVLHRLDLKEEIILEVIAGVTTFEDAVARFVLLNRAVATKPVYAHSLRGRTDEERAAWQLVSYLHCRNSEAAHAIANERESMMLGKPEAGPAKITGSFATSE